jgi:hypothetical protein
VTSELNRGRATTSHKSWCCGSATTLIKTANPFTAFIGVTAGGPYEDEKAMIIAGAATVINKSDMLQALHPAIIDAVEQVRNPV